MNQEDVQALKHNQTTSQKDSRPQSDNPTETFHACDTNGKFPSSSWLERGSLNDDSLQLNPINSITKSLPDNPCVCHKEKQAVRDRVIIKM